MAVEELVLAAQQVVLAMTPGRLGIGAVAGAARRGPGEGLQVSPAHRQLPAAVLELFRDAGLEQVIADALQRARRQPVLLVLAQPGGGQGEGVLGLPAGQQVRPVLPAREHAQPPLVVSGQADQGLVHPGQVGRPPVGLGQALAGQQGAHRQLTAEDAKAPPDCRRIVIRLRYSVKGRISSLTPTARAHFGPRRRQPP